MLDTYEGQAEREACAARVREELTDTPPERPFSLRDQRRIAGMADRCTTCRACPLIARWLAGAAGQPKSSATMLKLAS